MTDFSSRAEAIRSRCEAATDGDWETRDSGHGPMYVGPHYGPLVASCMPTKDLENGTREGNANFIAHARTDLPDALAEIARLTAQVETLQGEYRVPKEPVADVHRRYMLQGLEADYRTVSLTCLTCGGRYPHHIDCDPSVGYFKFKELLKAAERHKARADAAELKVETLQGERDEAVRRIPTEQPDRGGRLVLNAYGRACYDSGRECAEAQVTELQGLLGTATTLAATHFDRANAAEAQVETLQGERDKLQLALTTQTMCGLIQCPYMKRADAAEAQVTALRAERDQLRADNIQYAAEWKDCEPYLKDDGEQPAECLARNRKDIDALVTLLAQEKAQVTALRAEHETLKAEQALACDSAQFYVQRAADAKVLQRAAQEEVTALRALLNEKDANWAFMCDRLQERADERTAAQSQVTTLKALLQRADAFIPDFATIASENSDLRQQIRAALREQEGM